MLLFCVLCFVLSALCLCVGLGLQPSRGVQKVKKRTYPGQVSGASSRRTVDRSWAFQLCHVAFPITSSKELFEAGCCLAKKEGVVWSPLRLPLGMGPTLLACVPSVLLAT